MLQITGIAYCPVITKAGMILRDVLKKEQLKTAGWQF